MMSQEQLAEIAARSQERPNEDVTALLAEIRELNTRQSTAIGWIYRDVPKKYKP